MDMRHQDKQHRKGEKPRKESLRKWRGITVLVGSALLFAVGLGAIARNALLHESAIQAASDGFAGGAKETSITAVPAPRGVDAGNHFIAQASSNGASGASLAPVYDPMRRIVKIVETTGGTVTSTKQFVWAGDQLCEERDASGAVTRRFFSNGEQIGGTNYYYTRDHLGSVREMTDGSGNVLAALSYDPFGRPTKLQGTSPEPSFGYAGMYLHQRSGLNLAVNRAYNPTLGRFISRDPIDDPMFNMLPRSPEPEDPSDMLMESSVDQQLAELLPASPQAALSGLHQTNSYAYVANNPISQTDPSGLSILPPKPKPPGGKPGQPECPSEGDPRTCMWICREILRLPVDYCLDVCYGDRK